MKRKLLAGFSILLVVILAQTYSFFREKSQKNDIYSHLQTINQFDSKEVEGRYFVLHFWAKWCAPCAEEIPHLINFAKQAQEKLPGLKVLAVSLDESLEISKTILPNQGVGLPSNFVLLLDAQHALAEVLGSYQYPETYFYDTKGNVLEKWVGPQKWDTPDVIEYFKQKALPNP
jgi:thiol-disulfide isomerase/thioredoxin